MCIIVGFIVDFKVINFFDFFIEDWVEIWFCVGMVYFKVFVDDLRLYLWLVDEDGDGLGFGEFM